MEVPLTYSYNKTEEFRRFKEFMCFSLKSFNFEYETAHVKIPNLQNSKDLLDIPSAISTAPSSNFAPDSSLIFKAPETPYPSDGFCSERISRINNKFTQTLQYHLSLESQFFTVFFQDKLFIPLFAETVNFEGDVAALSPDLEKVTNYSLFNNYALYFSPVLVFGVLLIFILMKKLITEIKKYRHKYQ